MLAASGLAKAYGTRRLFGEVNLSLAPGRRVALVGGNGTGKTTLLEILAGMAEPDAGTVTRPRDARIGYLPQDLGEISEGTVRQQVAGGAGPLAELARTLEELEGRLGGPDGRRDELVSRYGEVQAQFEQLGGYALEAEVAKILAGLGFTGADAGRSVDELSGGWRMRVALGRLLLSEPDILLLDEPTNHLDVDSVAWLERRLAAWPGALLFVSHDRDFIDAVADRIVELASGATMAYEGGFASSWWPARSICSASRRLRPARPVRWPGSSASSSGSATRPPRPARCRAGSRPSRSWSAYRRPGAPTGLPASTS